MKILAINTEKGWRGGERQTLYHIEGMTHQGLEVEVLCREGEPLHQKLQSLPVQVHPISSSFQALSFLATQCQSFDLLHAHTAKAQSLAALTKGLHRRPLCYTRRVDFKTKGSFARWKYLKTNHTVALSYAIQKILSDAHIHNVSVIPSIVQKKELNVERAKQALDDWKIPKTSILATTSALVPHKDPITMVQSIHALKQLREDFVFLHFGEGPLRPQVEDLIQKYDLQDHYRLMGFVSDVEDFFSVFDGFVMSSEEEGLGSSVLDAFIYKVPVVSTDAGGLKDLLPEHGYMSPLKNPEALGLNLHHMLSHTEQTQGYVEQAYDYAKAKHSSHVINQQYIQLFEKIIQV